jgi:hypothetical protein
MEMDKQYSPFVRPCWRQRQAKNPEKQESRLRFKSLQSLSKAEPFTGAFEEGVWGRNLAKVSPPLARIKPN